MSKRIAFVAGGPSHGAGAHEHNAGCLLMAKLLNESVDGVKAVVHTNGWPEVNSFFEDADALVVYSDGGQRHPAIPQLQFIDGFAKQGKGIALLHYGVEVPAEEGGKEFLEWTGGYFEMHWSVNPHWDANFTELPGHPINNGVPPFEMNDEWYFHMRFRDNMEGVTPILSAVAPETTMERPDGPHSGNPDVRKAVANGEPQHLAWASEREDGGRGFGFTGGHYHSNWAREDLRKFILNALCWTAGMDVPENGFDTPTPSEEDMAANLDPK